MTVHVLKWHIVYILNSPDGLGMIMSEYTVTYSCANQPTPNRKDTQSYVAAK